MSYKEVYENWLSNPYFDEATKDEIQQIILLFMDVMKENIKKL